MSARLIKLGPGDCSDFETGARFFTALAYPARFENAARIDAAHAWAAAYLHEANRIDGSNEPFEVARFNMLVQLPADWCRTTMKTTSRRLRDRSQAARAVRPLVHDILGKPHGPVAGVKKFSQRQIALYLSGGDLEKAANFQKRIVRHSRPVLHIAIAQDLFLASMKNKITDYSVDLASAKVIEVLVALASDLQPKIRADPRFRIRQVEQITLKWVP